MRLSSTAVIVIGLLVTVPAAGKERLAIHTIDVYGNGSETIRRDLRSAFLGGLAVAGFDIVPDDDLQRAVKGAPHLLSCSSETCLAGIGPLVGARWVLAAKIEVVSSALIAIDTRIVDSQTGKIAARLVQKSDGPNTWDENRNLASSVGATLYQRLEPLIAVAAQLPIPNVPPQAPPESGKTPKGRWALRGTGIAAAALGLAGIIAGFVEFGKDNTRACDIKPPNVECPERLDTSGAQAFAFASGGVLLAGGGVLSYFGWRKSKPTVAIAPVLSPQTLGAKISVGF